MTMLGYVSARDVLVEKTEARLIMKVYTFEELRSDL